jgi:hypothetical protein
MDFDGTCTQVPLIVDAYLDAYRKNFSIAFGSVSPGDWAEAQACVRQHSPEAGWTVAGCPSAPAAADPYILADETARFILRRRDKPADAPPSWVNAQAYTSIPAPWREEAHDTFLRLIGRGLKIHFVSNSSSVLIQQRVHELFGPDHPALRSISIQSDAGKFRICEPPFEAVEISPRGRDRFLALPAVFAGPVSAPRRPIYLRRGSYFAAIGRVLGPDFGEIEKTLVCGDIWEMDLAMPFGLGACVHLLDRAAPFDTYPYEKEAVAAYGQRAKTSADLSGLLAWFE